MYNSIVRQLYIVLCVQYMGLLYSDSANLWLLANGLGWQKRKSRVSGVQVRLLRV